MPHNSIQTLSNAEIEKSSTAIIVVWDFVDPTSHIYFLSWTTLKMLSLLADTTGLELVH